MLASGRILPISATSQAPFAGNYSGRMSSDRLVASDQTSLLHPAAQKEMSAIARRFRLAPLCGSSQCLLLRVPLFGRAQGFVSETIERRSRAFPDGSDQRVRGHANIDPVAVFAVWSPNCRVFEEIIGLRQRGIRSYADAPDGVPGVRDKTHQYVLPPITSGPAPILWVNGYASRRPLSSHGRATSCGDAAGVGWREEHANLEEVLGRFGDGVVRN